MVKLYDVDIPAVVDTGASLNIINEAQWNILQRHGLYLSETSAKVFPYGMEQPLPLIGKFTAPVTKGDRQVQADFHVMKGKSVSLLGKQTSIDLKLVVLPQDRLEVRLGKARMENVIATNAEVFEGLGKLKDYKLKIHVDESVVPVAQPHRRIPFQLRKKVEEELQRLLNEDVIEPVNGPTTWSSPVVVVPKANDKIRLCVDMRIPNQAVKRERYPIPTVDDVLEEIGEAQVLSELDHREGYHQIELDEASRDITTFSTHVGNFRLKRLIYGVSCAPEVFQKIIQDVLQGCEGVRNISDNTIVYGRNQEEHDDRLDRVLRRFREKRLTLNRSKCHFGLSKLNFMGHTISGNGISPSTEKIKAIRDARTPSNASELRSFLGLINFCARYIPHLATKTTRLRELIKKEVGWEWTTEHDEDFAELKNCLTDKTVLAFYDKNARTRLVVDASNTGVEAVLLQAKRGEMFRPVVYLSRALTDIEKKYSQTEKEALAVVWAVKRCRLYLYGVEFELITDHKALEIIYGPRSKPSARIERWLLRMMPFTYKVIYQPGKTNIADPLSRLMQQRSEKQRTATEDYVNFVIKEATPKALSEDELRKATKGDPVLQRVLDKVRKGRWEPNNEDSVYKRVEPELSEKEGLLLKGTRIVIPSELQARVLDIVHETRQGIVKTKQLLRTKVWWPNMDKHVEESIRQCPSCQLVTIENQPQPIKSTPLPARPWEELALDICGPLPSAEYVLVLVDYHSRWPEAVIVKTTTTNVIITWLKELFASFGYPRSIKTDNGPQFVSRDFAEYLQQCNIRHDRTTPYWPQANGEVERLNRSFLKALKIGRLQNRNLKGTLLSFLQAYRSTPHCVTGRSPSELLIGRSMRTKLPEVKIEEKRGNVNVHDKERKLYEKRYADRRRRAKEKDIQRGDEVLLKRMTKTNKLSTEYWPKRWKVVNRYGPTITVQDNEGVVRKRNVTHVKKLFGGRMYFVDTPQIHQNQRGNKSRNVCRHRKDLKLRNEPEEQKHW
ncbi:uncharacterized protein K02A2.6-like [Ornithodoros turicata]|uniref:uncharacterized protein K02A2.6-like n=1 Tax=Ornithodoros turicata TaxID=34597 RepID=UPI0031391423